MKNLIFILLFLLGCSTSQRVLEKPNFNLKGKAAQKEYKRFEVDFITREQISFSSERFLEVGSLRADNEAGKKLMQDVSPRSVEMLEKRAYQSYISWGILALMVADALSNKELTNTYWMGLGVLAGYDYYNRYYYNTDIRDQFNQDLKKKFSPSLSYGFSF